MPVKVVESSIFLSTPSARRATADMGIDTKQLKTFLSTPSARRATSVLAGRQERI